jgi:heptosyltransferase-2
MTAPRVLFARTGAIGNALAAVPALRALRKAWPEAFIALILEPAAAQALAGCPYVDEILVYDKRGADSGLDGWLRMAFQARKRRFTHAILSKRFLRMSLLAFLSGASVRVGFEGFGFAINRAVKWNPKEHVVKTNIELLAELGITPCGYELEIWPTIEDKESAEQFLKDHDLLNHPFTVAINPGGVSHHGYLWPVENFVKNLKPSPDLQEANTRYAIDLTSAPLRILFRGAVFLLVQTAPRRTSHVR